MNILKSVPNLFSFNRLVTPCRLLSPFPRALRQSEHSFSIISTQSRRANVLSAPESIAPITDFFLTFVRTSVRNNFPRPSEYKRIKVFGWKTKIKTKSGRAIIMRRILKGRHVLTH